jgi:hypothetical protein
MQKKRKRERGRKVLIL